MEETAPPPIIPLPAAHERRPGPPLALGPGPVLVAAASPAATAAARALVACLEVDAGVEAKAATAGDGEAACPAASVVVRVAPGAAPTLTARFPPAAAAEGYELSIDAAGAEVRAETAAGAFYGVQSLCQLVTAAAATAATRGTVSIPAWAIVDAPAWRWRGLLIDTARRRASPEWLAAVICVAASLKLNVLHLHLTDDQGWRLPVPGRPRLASVGGVPGGGAYSEADIAALRRAAAAAHVAIVPGVDVPGHCGAALAAHPECACGGAAAGGGDSDGSGTPPPPPPPRAVKTSIGVHADTVLCAGSDAALSLMDDVVDAACAAFPDARWVHVGGDEVPKSAWNACADCAARANELGLTRPGVAPPGVLPADGPGGPRPTATPADGLHSWCVARAAARLAAAGRTALIWDDVEPGGLPADAGVTAWRGSGAGARAAAAGRPTVLAPAARCYLDYRQADAPGEPGAWWGVLDLETAYRFDPGEGDWAPGGGAPPRARRAASTDDADRAADRAAPPAAVSLAMGSTPPDSTGGPMSFADDGGGKSAAADDDDDDAASAPPPDARPDGRPPRPPPPRLPSTSVDSILGGQACLWTETVADDAGAEFLLFPRLHALAEALWSPLPPGGAGARDYGGFLDRLDVVVSAVEAKGMRRRPHR